MRAWRHRTMLAALLAQAVVAGAACAAPVSLEDLFSIPFPSDLIAAPKGGRVAWAFNDRGARNVWIANPGHEAARRLTNYAGDDGWDLGDLAWDPAGRTVFYVRGGNVGDPKPVNAASRPQGPTLQEIWAVSTDGGAPRRVSEGHTPVVSPRGDLLAFISSSQIWAAPTDGGQPAARLIQDIGRSSAPVWSPDGTRLAFVSRRGDHALVGVYDLAARTVRWMAPSLDVDRAVAWSPDGRKLAFIRQPTDARSTYLSRPDGEPWSIWVADAETGIGREVWRADFGPGSVFRNLYTGPHLAWTAGERLIFPWERTGWLRLYAVPAGGGRPEMLTPGDGEVFNMAVGRDGRIVYAANTDDETDRMHLWEVSASGGAPRRLTQGAGVEANPAIAADGDVVTIRSDGRLPMRPAVVSAGGSLDDLAPQAVPARFPASALSVPQAVTFKAQDGRTAHGQILLPAGPSKGPRPAIIYFHGGPRHQTLLGWHPRSAHAYLYGLNHYLASKGFIVLSVNFRGGIGYGLATREAPDFGPGGASEANDILGAVAYLRGRPDVDASRLGIYGMSYGGVMTGLGLTRAPDAFTAGVNIAGVNDWSTFLEEMKEPGAAAADVRRAFESSAMSQVDKWRAPTLLIYLDDDRNVPFSQGEELLRALRRNRGVEIEQLLIPNEVHAPIQHSAWLRMFDATAAFFQRRLSPEPGR